MEDTKDITQLGDKAQRSGDDNTPRREQTQQDKARREEEGDEKGPSEDEG